MKLSGVISEIFPIEIKKEDFRKRHFVLTDTSGGSVEELQFELIHDNTELIDKFAVGDEITVFFNIKGRRWKDPEGNYKYFITLRVWKIVEDSEEPDDKKKTLKNKKRKSDEE